MELTREVITARIKEAMDGRSNTWLKDKLELKGINLNDSQLSKRLSNDVDWKGYEAIACFEILNIPIKEES